MAATSLSPTRSQSQECCRLCGGRQLIARFRLMVIGKYDTQYSECLDCKSLQTEAPYWLQEVYNRNLSSFDTGAARRNLNHSATCYLVCKLFALSNVIDFGGGDGLLCRLLRDQNINCFVKDKYAQPTYAQGFIDPDFHTPDLVIALEVLEHLPHPAKNLDELFLYKPKALFFSTVIYQRNSKDWWYLTPESGQHVFFYSLEGMAVIAKKYNYQFIATAGFVLFLKADKRAPVRMLAIKILLKARAGRFVRALWAFLPTPGISKDRELIKRTVSRTQ